MFDAAHMKRAQLIIQDYMQGVLDDDYPDRLDWICGQLYEHHNCSPSLAEAAIESKWYEAKK